MFLDGHRWIVASMPDANPTLFTVVFSAAGKVREIKLRSGSKCNGTKHAICITT